MIEDRNCLLSIPFGHLTGFEDAKGRSLLDYSLINHREKGR